MKRFLIPFSMLVLLTLSPMYSMGSVFNPVGAVVKVGTTPLHLEKKTNCDQGLWGATLENKCRCCVLQKALQKDGTFRGNGKCLTDCKAGPCSPHVVKALEGQYASQDISSSDTDDEDEDYGPRRTFKVSGLNDVILERSIIEDAQTVKMLRVSPETEKDSSDLTSKGIKQVLQEFFAEPGPTFRSPKEVHEMQEKIFAGGAQTDQLFGVFEKGKLAYIVKVLKKESELRNLILLKDYFHQYNLLNPDRPKDFPAIAMPFGEAQYKVKGKTQSIIIMPAAPGSSLHDITENFVDEAHTPHLEGKIPKEVYGAHKRKLQQAFSILGDRLGRFHGAGMLDKEGHLEKWAIDKKGLTGLSRNVHGDFHSNNVFYGFSGEREPTVTFIDPETLVESYEKPREVARDLRHFYIFLTFHVKSSQNVADKVGNMKDWHSLFIKPFLEAYIKGYGLFKDNGDLDLGRLTNVVKIVRRALTSFDLGEDSLRMLAAVPFGLIKSQKDHLIPILDTIEESIIVGAVKSGQNEEGDFQIL
jgi:hypothetical protein